MARVRRGRQEMPATVNRPVNPPVLLRGQKLSSFRQEDCARIGGVWRRKWRGLRFGEGPMRPCRLGMVLPGAVVVVCAALLAVAGVAEAVAARAAVAVTQAGTWGEAIEVPRSAALNRGGAPPARAGCCAA